MESELEHQLRELIGDPKAHNDDQQPFETLFSGDDWSPTPWHREQWHEAALNQLADRDPVLLTRRRAA
jgi:hypothetical protein